MDPAKILLVDDTAEIRTLVRRILVNQGYQVVEACDAESALAACRRAKGKIDLLLTDIKMPGMDGIELASSLTASYPAIQLLFVSGQCDESEIRDRISEHGFGFLSKPFMPQLLIEAVKEILGSVKRPPQASGAVKKKRRHIG